MDGNEELPRPEIAESAEKSLHFKEKEITLQNGEKAKLPLIHIEKMRLYHGSPVPNIDKFHESEPGESTVGSGLYLTAQKEAARGYAIVRSKTPEEQFVYETEIGDMDILNLSTRNSLLEFAKYFQQELIDLRDRLIKEKGSLSWIQVGIFDRTFEEIGKLSQDKPVALKNLVYHFQNLVRDILVKQDLNGLMTIEGGESGNGVIIGDHDSYVIFQPEKVKIINEEKVS